MKPLLLCLLFFCATVEAQPRRAAATIAAQGVAPADTGAIFAGLREGLQADSTIQLVWRPARGADAIGQTLEVAPVMITMLVLGDGPNRGFSFRAFDVRTSNIVARATTRVAVGESLVEAAARAGRDFAKASTSTWTSK